jgi:serine/threonine-protein kinase
VYLSFGGASAGGLIATQRTLVWVNRDGREEPLTAPQRPYSIPRVSPDGTQVAVDVRDAENDIWVWSLERATLTRLTFDPLFDRFPVWYSDSRRIAFSSQRGGSRGDLFWQMADGTGQAELLAKGKDNSQVFPTSFSPDGTRLLVHGDPNGTQVDDIGIVSLGGGADKAVTPLLATMFEEENADVSPDGRWLAYESDESGQLEVYVRPFPKVDAGRWQVSTGGGTQPAWARSGRELFYRSGDAVLSVPVETSASFVARNPVVLFKGQYAPTLGGRNYDVSPDGRRFLMLKVAAAGASAQTPPARFTVVENWFEELKRLVPTK